MKTIQVYAEGYDAYLRFVRGSREWSRIILQEQAACQNPYTEDSELHHVWLQGWVDAVAETYAPREFLGD